MSTCKNRLFGHSPAHAGEGCDGCDAEHARLVEKHIGSGPYVDPFERGAAVAFGLLGMAEAIRERTWTCIMCECDTDGDKCEWCSAPRGLRCPACEVGPCEDHVRFK